MIYTVRTIAQVAHTLTFLQRTLYVRKMRHEKAVCVWRWPHSGSAELDARLSAVP